MLRRNLDVIIRRARLRDSRALACILIPGKRILARRNHAQEQAAHQAKDEMVSHSSLSNYIINLKTRPSALINLARRRASYGRVNDKKSAIPRSG
jgi:hypothetical protein